MNHSIGPFIGDVFTGKGTAYFSVEGRGILPGLSGSFAAVTDTTAPLGQLVLRSVPLVACIGIVLILIGLVWAWRDRSPARLAIIAFAIVGFVAAAPDLAPQHLTEETPLLLGLPVIAVACRGATEKRRGPSTVRVALVTCAASMLAFGVVSTAIWAHRPVLRSPDRVALSDIPHFSGTMVSAASETRDRADFSELRQDTHGTVFLAFLSAGYYYLAGGLHDPTPYDYPGRSDLGANGEPGVVHTLRLRHVRWVCLQRTGSTQQNQSPIAPRQLDSYVRHSFRFVAHLNACNLYQSRIPAGDLTTTDECATPCTRPPVSCRPACRSVRSGRGGPHRARPRRRGLVGVGVGRGSEAGFPRERGEACAPIGASTRAGS
jgi:hypothetical protein